MRYFNRASHEHPAVHTAATDDYVTLNTQTQGDQPQYDVIQLNQRTNSHNYENVAAASLQ